MIKFLAQPRPDLSRPRFAWTVATFSLISLNLLAWCAVAWFYHLSPLASQNSQLLLRVGAANGELLRAGQYWRIVSSQFLHVHLLHLVFNMVALLLLGYLLERESGAWRLAIIYLGSGIIGQTIGVAVAPQLVSSGASQAIMGLAGGAAVGLFRRPHLYPAILIILFVVAVQVILDVASVGYIKAGHLGGFCAGAVIGYAVCRPGTAV